MLFRSQNAPRFRTWARTVNPEHRGPSPTGYINAQYVDIGTVAIFHYTISTNTLFILKTHLSKYTIYSETQIHVYANVPDVLIFFTYINFIITGLDRTLSDHVPLYLKTDSSVSPKRDFRYELCWKFRPDFKDIVWNSWSLPVRSRSNIDIWREKIKRLKKR